MKKALVRYVSAAGGAAALLAVFGPGTAAAINEYEGQTYADAANSIAQSGGTPKISSKVGSFLPTDQCTVTGSHNASFLDSSGNNPGGVVLLDLNCNYAFALPGVPGNSRYSPEGKEAYESALEKAQEAQEQQLAEQQAAAEGEG